MKNIFLLPGVFALFFLSSCEESNNINAVDEVSTSILKEGYWKGHFMMQDEPVPILLKVGKSDGITIINDGEEINLQKLEIEGDSATAYFVNYPNYLRFKVDNREELNGYFWNTEGNGKGKLLLSASYLGMEDTDYLYPTESNQLIEGKWEITFRPGTELAYPSIGDFKQNENIVTGTFLKRSGDSRFLKGTISENILKLYAFDGSHASLYVAKIEGDSITGKYFPNDYSEIEFIGIRNEDFQLEDADSITYLVKDDFKLQFKTLNGADFSYPNQELRGKPVIFQIMGTWCPNCLDETKFFKELYTEYNSRGLEIIGVSYENTTEFEEQVKRIKRYATNEQIPYPILVGGHLSADTIAKDFDMLNAVTAFPTAIYINKKGEVVKIHTGFSGPGTKEVYEQFKKKTIQFIEELLE